MSTDVVSRTLSVHQEHEFLARLEDAGLDKDDAQRVIESRRNALARTWLAQLREASTPTRAIGTIVGSFNVDVDNRSVEQMVAAGGYHWTNDLITDANFPRQRPVESVTIELVALDQTATTIEVEAALASHGLLLPTMEHQLSFGEAHPDEQRQRPIVFAGAAFVSPHGSRNLGALNGEDSDRYCSLRWDGSYHHWNPPYLFAGVRK